MDYLGAQDLIRSEHLDLVREGGLNGFKPFETTCGAATEPLIRLSPAEPLTLDDFAANSTDSISTRRSPTATSGVTTAAGSST